MPFSSLTDPVELARAQAALDAACEELRSTSPDMDIEKVRLRLAYIIAALVAVADDEDDLTRRAVARFLHSSAV